MLTHSPGPQPIWSMTKTSCSRDLFHLLIINLCMIGLLFSSLFKKSSHRTRQKKESVDSFRLNETPFEQQKKYLNKSNQIGFKWFDWLESQKWPSIKPLQHTEIDTGYRWFPFLAPLLCTDDSNSRLNWCFGAFSIEAISTFDDKKKHVD